MSDAGVWAAPLLLIPGVGLLILSTAARFANLHQELLRLDNQGSETAIAHLVRRAHLMHGALVALYVSVTLLAAASVLGTLANRWFPAAAWLPEVISFGGVVFIVFSAVQLIRESRLLITVIVDATGGSRCDT